MERFLSLAWYDACIEFLFKLAAKTSEPALALGLTVSAADYLSHGAVMAGHPAFSLGWAWTQALALESSSGVVFVYALQSFKQADKIKGGLYLALALGLAVVGGSMLLLQVNNITMGSAESAIPVLNVLRVIVSIAYIFLLRAKHIRFTDLADTREQVAPVQPVPLGDVDTLIEAIVARVCQRVNVVEEQQLTLAPARVGTFPSKEQEIAAIVQERPGASVEEIAQAAGCTVRTAQKWLDRLEAKG